MTYRIKRSIKNGLLKFYPQYRRWFWWWDMTEHGCYTRDHAKRIIDKERLKHFEKLIKAIN